MKDPRVWKPQPGSEKDADRERRSAWSGKGAYRARASQGQFRSMSCLMKGNKVIPLAIDEWVPGDQHFLSLLIH